MATVDPASKSMIKSALNRSHWMAAAAATAQLRALTKRPASLTTQNEDVNGAGLDYVRRRSVDYFIGFDYPLLTGR